MAEVLLNNLCGDQCKAFSADTNPTTVNPCTIQVMKEIGMDISGHETKNILDFKGASFDYVVTVCDDAKESRPFFPGGGRFIHKSFEDPSSFIGSPTAKLTKFRKIRDEIRTWIKHTFMEEMFT
jgi:arsenate reductase